MFKSTIPKSCNRLLMSGWVALFSQTLNLVAQSAEGPRKFGKIHTHRWENTKLRSCMMRIVGAWNELGNIKRLLEPSMHKKVPSKINFVVVQASNFISHARTATTWSLERRIESFIIFFARWMYLIPSQTNSMVLHKTCDPLFNVKSEGIFIVLKG